MNVLQVDTEPGFRGGQRQLLFLCRGLRRLGVETTVALRGGTPLEQVCRDEGFPFVVLRQSSPWDPRAVADLAGALHRERFDVVHAHASHAHTAAVTALRLPGGPPLLVSRRVDFGIGRLPLNRYKYGRGVARFLAVSRAVAEVLRAGGVEAERIELVAEGVEPLPEPARSRDEVRREIGLDPSTLLLLGTGALVDHKDHPTAIRAVARASADVHLAMAGDGELKSAIEQCVAEEGAAGRVTLLGHRTDVPDLLAAADLFVVSSHLEGLCTSLMDAGLARLPVAGTAAGGIPEVVVDGETGLLVPPRDADGLAAAIDRLATDLDLRQRMGDAAAARIEGGFMAEHMVERTLRIYEEVAP